MTWVTNDYALSFLSPLLAKPWCNMHCKITAILIAALAVFKKFRGGLECATDWFYCNACCPKYHKYLIRCIFFLKNVPKTSSCIFNTRKNCRLLNLQKYLANCGMHVVCYIYRTYSNSHTSRACDNSVWCRMLWLTHSLPKSTMVDLSIYVLICQRRL
jgi:hypothetical protein